MKMVRVHLTVHGLVQGVFFRATATEVAKKHGVCGWVKNNANGTVEAVVEGEEEAVKRVVEWCRTGPPLARVERVDVSWEQFRNEFDDFQAVTRHNTY